MSHFSSPTAEPRSRRRWLFAAIPIIIIMMYLVPYTLLSDVNAWYGSFLFWTAATLVVLMINAVLAFGWED